VSAPPAAVTFAPSPKAYRQWLGGGAGIGTALVALPAVLAGGVLSLVLIVTVLPVVAAVLLLTFRRSRVTVADGVLHRRGVVRHWSAPLGSLTSVLFTFTLGATVWSGNTEATLRVHDAATGRRRLRLHVGLWDRATIEQLARALDARSVVVGEDDLRRGGTAVTDYQSRFQAWVFRMLHDHAILFVVSLVLGSVLAMIVVLTLIVVLS
jgi:hypothetical protein